MLLSLSLQGLAAAAADAPLNWQDLGLKNYLFGFSTPLGEFQLRWYSLAYLAAIIFSYWHISKSLKSPGAPMAQRHADDLFFYCTLGVILGGRLGYATFYTGGDTGLPSLWSQPGELMKLWNGGMSFHGGLIGVALAVAWVCWRGKLSFLRVMDYVTVTVPVGMFFGRMANFVNAELWGRVAGPDVPWAMVFPGAGEAARHPSQLYEAGLEGLLLAAVMLYLFWRTRARWRPGLLASIFAIGMALSRFLVEFYREPDAQLQEFARSTGMSMGQWLTLPLLAVGVIFAIRAISRPELNAAAPGPE